MKKILFVTDCAFPGSAMASRLLTFSYLFNDLGYETYLLSTKTNNKIEENKEYKIDNLKYEIVSSKRSYGLQSLLGNENLKNRVDNLLKDNEYELIFLTNLGANFNEILKTCRQNNKKVILEQCEWFDYSSYKLKKLDPRYIRFENNIKNNFKKVDGIISITRLLNNYYLSLNKDTINIPSIINVQKRKYSIETNNEKIKLVFTGNLSTSKELIEPILESLNSDTKYLDNFIFDMYGFEKDELLSKLNNKDLINLKNINCHGYIRQDLIEDILIKADYQIFIRPYRKSSNAGFPTKLCESLSCGTPVISNDTGDIGLYLKNGYNGFVVEGNDYKSIINIFDQILKLNKIEYNRLRENARKTALEKFDYRNYLESVKELIDRI